MADYGKLIRDARQGDLGASASLVACTQQMVAAVCHSVLHDREESLDASQETFLRALRRLDELQDPAAFPSWVRRIAITVSHNLRRRRRPGFVDVDTLAEGEFTIPMLDEKESRWTESQRQVLAAALVQLATEERRICDRFYHGGWSLARLAADAGISEPAMRKRLQRIRERLRKEIEMKEMKDGPGGLPADLPQKVVELLARPRLTDLPENPVGKMGEMLRGCYPDYQLVETAEIVDASEVRRVFQEDRIRADRRGVHRVAGDRYLRTDLTAPLLLAATTRPLPLRLVACGQVYRADGPESATRLEAFHQFEVLTVADGLSPWQGLGDVLRTVTAVFPGAAVRVEPVDFTFCTMSWEIEADMQGRLVSVAGCGLYSDNVVRALGGEPRKTAAFGVGFGLERLAAIKCGIDDIRKLAAVRVGGQETGG